MKKLLLLMTAAFAAMSLCAAPVDQATATRIAKKYLAEEMYAGKIMAPAALNPVLLKAEIGNEKMNKPVYYIFNTSTTFLVVAAEDRAETILMVGDNPLKDINHLAPAMQDILNLYKTEIQFLHENPNLKVEKISGKNTSLRAVTYGPMLTAMWDQEAPYNNLCKFTYNNRTYTCLTGCPATSAAIVMYHWKFPASVGAIGSYSSTLDIGTYYSNEVSFTYPGLDATTFDWGNMKDTYRSYNTAQGNAVATLMRYIGQAEQMMYGVSGSGIYTNQTNKVANMFKNWGYASTCRVVYKSSYSETNWANLIIGELAAGRPIIYNGVDNSNGGHAFNVDGYRDSDNKYHVNFGWSGDGNNWYAMNAFTYSGMTFSSGQQAVIGIEPPGGASPTPELTVNPTSLTFTGNTGKTYTKTFTVTGTDLLGDVTVALSGSGASVYSVSPTTITAAQAAAGATVTVTYSPTAAGTKSATVTVSSLNATNQTVSLSGTATTVPVITVEPESLTFNALVDQTVSQSFTLKGENLTGSVSLSLNDPAAVFTVDKISVSRSAANNGTTVTVTFTPYEPGTETAVLNISSNGAETVVMPLTGYGTMETHTPVMLPAVEEYINLTEFRADWTDATPAGNVASYTLEVSGNNEPEPDPDPVLLHSVTASAYTGSSYNPITLPAPWGGTNVRAGNSEIYFRNNYNNDGSYGNITYTVPAGYTNAKFTMMITSYGTNANGAGNLTVATPQTAAVTKSFTAGATNYWVVTASSGDVITITTPDAQYSPSISLMAVYSGNAAPSTLMANESGNANYRLITGITDKFYTVENLTAEGTFTYKVKAIYIDGTESEWSNIEQVTLFQNGHGFVTGDVDHNGSVSISDVTALIDYVLDNSMPACTICADVDGNGRVDISDVTELIDGVLAGNYATFNMNISGK